jgi:hypothetical protein
VSIAPFGLSFNIIFPECHLPSTRGRPLLFFFFLLLYRVTNKAYIFRPCLTGLRLQLEPCQTVVFALAPGVESALEPLAASKGEAEPRFRDFIWLCLTRPSSFQRLPLVAPVVVAPDVERSIPVAVLPR